LDWPGNFIIDGRSCREDCGFDGGEYQILLHKYYVDELYGALFVRPLIDGSTRILWHEVDQKIIDGR